MSGFKTIVWDSKPNEFDRLKDGRCRVNTGIEEMAHVSDDGHRVVQYKSLSCVMSATECAAYMGAALVANKREQEIQDETILKLIEEGSL